MTRTPTNRRGLEDALGSPLLAAQLCEMLDPDSQPTIRAQALTFKGEVEVSIQKDEQGKLAYSAAFITP